MITAVLGAAGPSRADDGSPAATAPESAPATPPAMGSSPPAAEPRPAECPPCVVPAWAADLLPLMNPADATARAAAATRLGTGGEPGAGPALIYAARNDPAPEVRAAAVRALSHHRGEAVEEVLASRLGATTEDLTVRRAAIGALAAQGTESAARALWSARDEPEVSEDARVALATTFPVLWARWSAAEPSLDRRGRVLLIGAMGLHGGYFLNALAARAGGDPGALAFSGGAILGSTTPFLLTLHRSVPMADAAWLTSTTTWGLASGLMTAGAVGAESDAAYGWASLGGQLGGLGLGLLTLDRQPYSAGDIAYADAAGIAGGLAGLGGVLAAGAFESQQTTSAALQLGSLAGLVGGALAAPHLTLSQGDQATLGASTAAGMWWGWFAPALVLGPDTASHHRTGGLLIGSAVGLAGGSVLTQLTEPRPGQVVRTSLGAGYGTAILGGGGLLPSEALSERAISSLVLVGGLAGAGATVWSDDGRPYTVGDDVAVLFGTTWGLWQGAGFGSLGDPRPTRTAGAALLGTGLGGVSGMVAAQAYDPDAATVGIASAGGVWGGWLTGWGAHVARKHGAGLTGDHVLLATLLGSDAGVLATGLALSPVFEANPERLGWIDAAGLLGMGLGTSIAAVFTQDVAEGNLIGSTVGLVAGVIATASMNFERPVAGADPPSAGFAADWWPQLVIEPEPEGGLRRLLVVTFRR